MSEAGVDERGVTGGREERVDIDRGVPALSPLFSSVRLATTPPATFRAAGLVAGMSDRLPEVVAAKVSLCSTIDGVLWPIPPTSEAAAVGVRLFDDVR